MPKAKLAGIGQFGAVPKIDNSKQNAVYYVVLMILLLSLSISAPFINSQSEDPIERWYRTHPFVERMSISQVSVGASPSSSLSIIVVGVQGVDSKGEYFITLDGAIIKNCTGGVDQRITMGIYPVIIPRDDSQTTVQVNLTSPLLSGEQYTVTLVTQAGSVFVSPSFTAP